MALLQGEYTQISARNTFQEIDSSFEGQPKNVVNFGRVARELVELETSPDGFRTFEGDRLLVASHVHDFIDAQRKLDRLGSGSAVADARDRELTRVIRFNHAVRQLINNDRKIGLSEILKFTSEIYMITHPGEFAHNKDSADASRRLTEVTGRIEQILRGMRSELTVQEVLGRFYATDDDENEDEQTAIKREKEGVDIWLDIAPDDAPESRWIGVDAKTSEAAAVTARKKQPYGMERVVIAANTRDSDYVNGGFRLKPGVADRIAPDMLASLDDELRRAGYL